MDCKYLTEDHLKGFEKYKYSSQDTSPLSNYVMHPFWNQTVKLVPKWVAPNLLTFTGFLFTILNAGLLSYFDYEFFASSNSDPHISPVPLWVWLVCAVSHFLAHTLDGIDGKQARRTNSSGPLGELMDHGLDSWTALLVPFCIYSLFGRGDHSYGTFRVLFIFWTVFLTFYLSHWEKYNTGILYLPWSYDASQLTLLLMYVVTFLYTHELWKFTLPVFHLHSGQIFELVSHGTSLGLSIPITVYNVYRSYKTNSNIQPTLWEALKPLFSLSILFIVTTGWAYFSPSDIISKDPRIFFFMVGTVFSNVACRLIVCQMSSTKVETFNWFLYPLTAFIIGIFSFDIFKKNELTILRGLTIFFTVAHIHYGVCIVRQMCDHFKISCFSLKRKHSTKKR